MGPRGASREPRRAQRNLHCTWVESGAACYAFREMRALAAVLAASFFLTGCPDENTSTQDAGMIVHEDAELAPDALPRDAENADAIGFPDAVAPDAVSMDALP